MESVPPEAAALETTEKVIAALTLIEERDAAIDALIASIDEDRSELLASMIGGHAIRREPGRIRRRGFVT